MLTSDLSYVTPGGYVANGTRAVANLFCCWEPSQSTEMCECTRYFTPHNHRNGATSLNIVEIKDNSHAVIQGAKRWIISSRNFISFN